MYGSIASDCLDALEYSAMLAQWAEDDATELDNWLDEPITDDDWDA